MKFRWTMKDLETMTDEKVILGLINERTSDLNPYTPLSNRLNDIRIKIEKKMQIKPDPTITTRWNHTKYQCVNCEKTFANEKQVDNHIEKTNHCVNKLELVKP